MKLFCKMTILSLSSNSDDFSPLVHMHMLASIGTTLYIWLVSLNLTLLLLLTMSVLLFIILASLESVSVKKTPCVIVV